LSQLVANRQSPTPIPTHFSVIVMKAIQITTAAICLSCCAHPAFSKEKVDHVTHLAGTPVDVSMSVFTKTPKQGRSTGIYSHYRPGFDFDGGGERVYCEVTLPGKDALIEPGAVGKASILCNSDFKTIQGLGKFKYYEGTTLVGEGQLN
jgi:hypothetical protein